MNYDCMTTNPIFDGNFDTRKILDLDAMLCECYSRFIYYSIRTMRYCWDIQPIIFPELQNFQNFDSLVDLWVKSQFFYKQDMVAYTCSTAIALGFYPITKNYNGAIDCVTSHHLVLEERMLKLQEIIHHMRCRMKRKSMQVDPSKPMSPYIPVLDVVNNLASTVAMLSKHMHSALDAIDKSLIERSCGTPSDANLPSGVDICGINQTTGYVMALALYIETILGDFDLCLKLPDENLQSIRERFTIVHFSSTQRKPIFPVNIYYLRSAELDDAVSEVADHYYCPEKSTKEPVGPFVRLYMMDQRNSTDIRRFHGLLYDKDVILLLEYFKCPLKNKNEKDDL